MFKNTKWVRLYPNKKPINIYELLTGESVKIVDNYFFDKEDWREVIKKLAIYPSQIHFTHPLLIRNTQDLKDFIFMKQYNFVGLKGLILIGDYNDFEKFVIENKEGLRQYGKSLFFNIGYDKNNLYTEIFYLSELIPIFKRAVLLSKMGIEGYRTELVLYSDQPLTKAIYYALFEWFNATTANRMIFEKYYKFKYRGNKKLMTYYYNFVKNKPEYRKWFIKTINEEE